MAFEFRNPRDWIVVLPDLARLLWRLLRDERTPRSVRIGVLALAGYLAVPVDVVPDWIPFAGQIDDVLVVSLGTRTLLRRVPADILLEHWDGEPGVLAQLVGRELEAPSGP